MDLRPVLYTLGLLLSTMAASMVLPLLVDLHAGNDNWKVFFLCIILTSFFSGTLILSNSSERNNKITLRQGFLMVSFAWIILSFFAALPLWLGLNLSVTDAVLEAVSGLTTTGATVITDLENTEPGILLWRSLIQWLGGIGIVIMVLSVMPFLDVGGMQLFQSELSESQKALPRAAKLARSIGFIYALLTALCLLSYMAAGLPLFDAVNHAMTTISTGGFSTHSESFGYFKTTAPLLVAIVFMIVGSLPFILYLKLSKGHAGPLLTDSQVRFFFLILGVSIALITGHLVLTGQKDFLDALLNATFNVVSLMTGTGFTNADYNLWGSFPVCLFFFLIAMGACAGSTTCGIKIFRFQILLSVANIHFRKLLHPNATYIVHYNGRPAPESVPLSVMSFFFLYVLSFAVLAALLTLTGLDLTTAMSGAITSLSNAGPGMGDVIGPQDNFSALPDASKWLMAAGMLLGRLELYPILILFSRHLWRG